MEPVLERADSEWWRTDSQTAEFWLISGNQKHEKNAREDTCGQGILVAAADRRRSPKAY